MIEFKELSDSQTNNETKEFLLGLIARCQERTFSEEIDLIETQGGDYTFGELLKVDYKTGIQASEVEERREQYGTNKLEEASSKGFFELIWNTLEDFTLRILLVAAAASMIANMIIEKDHREIAWIEGFAIFMAVMISSVVTATNDYQKEKQFRKLNMVANSRKQVNVWRDGGLTMIHESDLVSGDLVKISEGMDLNADMILLEGFEVTTDESALTGEPDPFTKKTYRECLEKRDEVIAEGKRYTATHTSVYSPILMSGTKVLTGEGKALVLIVGTDSCIGKIRSIVQQEPETTPLQEKLNTVATHIGKFGLISALITLTVLVIRFMIDRVTSHTLGDVSEYLQLINFIIIAITVIVVAIPEGLPLAVTLSLAYSVKKMLKDNNLVRRLDATETMGGTNNICSDKTGTLTQNKMTLASIWNGELIKFNQYQGEGRIDNLLPKEYKTLIMQAFACNSSASLSPLQGSKTEIALLEFLEVHGESCQRIKDQYINENSVKFPFSSQRKRMSVVFDIERDGTTKRRMHLKGASEIVLGSCNYFYNAKQGESVFLTPKMRQDIEQEIENLAEQAYRTICIAYKDLDGHEDLVTKNDHNVFSIEEDNFTLLGVLGIKDILRREVKGAVAKCKAAGIKVRMVTGDNKTTAKAIARECGILNPNDHNSLVLTGPEFMGIIGGLVCKECRTKDCDCPRDKGQAEREGRPMRVDSIANRREFDNIYEHLDILARSRPEDKYALVVGLLEKGAVVAVTGDGTNDAPALKRADVGFAMNSGTDVAKEAADIILLDDNFASIVESVKWGRNIYDNIRKFLQFQLTVNIVAVGITLIGAAVLKEAVLTAVQLLWVNLIMDTLASLALATEAPTEDLLNRKPHNRNDYILSRTIIKHIIGQALYQLTIVCFLVFSADQWAPEYLPDDTIDGHPGELKYYSESHHMRSGRAYLIVGGDLDYKRFEADLGPSRHFTLVFNTFVFMQVFNFLNCRKIKDEINIFSGITRNGFFIAIVSFIAILQFFLGNYGGLPLSVSFYGMDKRQWGIAIALASGCLVWSVMLRFITFGRRYSVLGVPVSRSRSSLTDPNDTSNHGFSSKKLFKGIPLTDPSSRRVKNIINLVPCKKNESHGDSHTSIE